MRPPRSLVQRSTNHNPLVTSGLPLLPFADLPAPHSIFNFRAPSHVYLVLISLVVHLFPRLLLFLHSCLSARSRRLLLLFILRTFTMSFSGVHIPAYNNQLSTPTHRNSDAQQNGIARSARSFSGAYRAPTLDEALKLTPLSSTIPFSNGELSHCATCPLCHSGLIIMLNVT